MVDGGIGGDPGHLTGMALGQVISSAKQVIVFPISL
jgi:hypothetical protein